MPIKIPKQLPAKDILEKENIFVMDDERADMQDIRPLRVLIVNLMPTKIETETQLIRLLSNSPLQIKVTLIGTESYIGKNTPLQHLHRFYHTFSEVKNRRFDGMIITGAPVEEIEFSEVKYWDELKEIFEFAKKSVTSTLFICWGAQAALHYYYGLNKYTLDKKLFGVFEHTLDHKKSMLFRGFDDTFVVPHSRHTTCLREDIEKVPEIKILASSEEAGIYASAGSACSAFKQLLPLPGGKFPLSCHQLFRPYRGIPHQAGRNIM